MIGEIGAYFFNTLERGVGIRAGTRARRWAQPPGVSSTTTLPVVWEQVAPAHATRVWRRWTTEVRSNRPAAAQSGWPSCPWILRKTVDWLRTIPTPAWTRESACFWSKRKQFKTWNDDGNNHADYYYFTLSIQSSRPCRGKRRQTGGSSSWAVRRSTQKRRQSVCKELRKRSTAERPECPGPRCSSALPCTTDNAWVSTTRVAETTQTCGLRSSCTDTVAPENKRNHKCT